MPTLRALPNRVLLSFPPPMEKVGSIYISERSQIRPEFGVIHDIGEPIGEENTVIAGVLKDLQAKGMKIAVTYSSGVGYMTDSQGNALKREDWTWLADLRSYRIGELAAYLVES